MCSVDDGQDRSIGRHHRSIISSPRSIRRRIEDTYVGTYRALRNTGGGFALATDGEADYFATFGPTTNVDGHADRIASLPTDPAALGEIVRGVLTHNWTAEMNGITSSPDRDGMRTFGAGPTIDRIVELDSAPLDQPRLPEVRLIGYCYHFALVHCALLRANGVPSRTRCGFANYLADGKWTDHWVVEYWDGDEWRLNDPQIGLDQLSHDDFRDGVRAWQLCRSGAADPSDHGIGELWGWDELPGSLVNDLGSLNKIEIGDWDWCELLRVDPLDQPHADVDAHLDGRCKPRRAWQVTNGPPCSLRPRRVDSAIRRSRSQRFTALTCDGYNCAALSSARDRCS